MAQQLKRRDTIFQKGAPHLKDGGCWREKWLYIISSRLNVPALDAKELK